MVPNYTAVPNIISIKSGTWSDPSVWNTGQVPASGDVVIIQHYINYDTFSTNSIKAIGVKENGTLAFRNDLNTKLTVTTLMVFAGGYLEIGTTTKPIPANLTAQVVFADATMDTVFDPEAYGHGLIVFGKIRMCGAAKTPFVEVAEEMFAGDTSVDLQSAVSGWREGDLLYFPDSRQLDWFNHGTNYDPKWEENSISSISLNSRTVNFNTAISFDHPGARNAHNRKLRFFPHLPNLTRNITLQSENQNGTRAHTIYIHRADVDIRYTQFVNLGRTIYGSWDNTTFDNDGHVTHVGTNQNGRWPVHFHHVMGPQTAQDNGYQSTFIGNVIREEGAQSDKTWYLTIHDTHYGLFQDNVIYNFAGAGLATMIGNETENLIDHNFVARGEGTGERVDTTGQAGSGYWFRGFNNHVKNNIACNLLTDGYNYEMIYFGYYLGDCDFPNFQGADTSDSSQYTTKNGHIPLLENDNNMIYGASPHGITQWWTNTPTDSHFLTEGGPGGTIKNLKSWHLHAWVILHYASLNLICDGWICIYDTETTGSKPQAIIFDDYTQKGAVFSNGEIHAANPGITAPGVSDNDFLIEKSKFFCYTAVAINSMGSVNGAYLLNPFNILINNCTFINPYNGTQTCIDITPNYQNDCNYILPMKCLVTDFNGISGDKFQVFFNEQDSLFILPYVTPPLGRGVPVANLTNQQCYERYGLCFAGELLPAGTYKRPGITGPVLPT